MKEKFRTPGETYEEREQYWLKRVEEARRYPGGIQKYCRDHCIGKELYYHWFQKVKSKADEWQTPLDTNQRRRKNPPKAKSGRRGSPPRPKREWLALVNECKKSGLRPSTFARKKNIHKVTFCRWYRRLGGKVIKARQQKTQPKPNAASDFLPVSVIESEPVPPKQDSGTNGLIEIILANGRKLRVGNDCELEFLEAVLSVVEGR